MLPVFIGISKRFNCIRGLTERSIRRNTKHDVEIHHLYPKAEAGCTGFTNVRYTIKRGVYLDVDMIVLGDITELMSYHLSERYVCMKDGSSEVGVIDVKEHWCTNKHQEHFLPKAKIIPPEWNVQDKVIPGMKLLHFTDMHTQPWFFDHPNKEAVAIYERYRH